MLIAIKKIIVRPDINIQNNFPQFNLKNDFLLKNVKNKRSIKAIIARIKIGNLRWKRPNMHIIIIGIIQLIENERILSIFFLKENYKLLHLA